MGGRLSQTHGKKYDDSVDAKVPRDTMHWHCETSGFTIYSGSQLFWKGRAMDNRFTPRRIAAGILNRTSRKLAHTARMIEDPTLRDIVRRGMPRESCETLGKKWLRDMDFQTVLDVGANVGQFATAARAILPDATIYSFEPLPDCFLELERRMSRTGKFRAFNVGLGADRGELQFNRSSFAPSSSFRKMAALHKQNYPWTVGSEPVNVKVETLDGLAATLDLVDPILLKIDVQGYEDRVLAGGKATCSRAAAIIVEVSFETLYEGQPLFDDIYRSLTGMGFVYKGDLDETAERKTGRNLYADAIFLRPTSSGAGAGC